MNHWTIRPGKTPSTQATTPFEEMPPELTSLVGLRDDGTTPEPTVAGMAIGFQVVGGKKCHWLGRWGGVPKTHGKIMVLATKPVFFTLKTYKICRFWGGPWQLYRDCRGLNPTQLYGDYTQKSNIDTENGHV